LETGHTDVSFWALRPGRAQHETSASSDVRKPADSGAVLMADPEDRSVAIDDD